MLSGVGRVAPVTLTVVKVTLSQETVSDIIVVSFTS